MDIFLHTCCVNVRSVKVSVHFSSIQHCGFLVYKSTAASQCHHCVCLPLLSSQARLSYVPILIMRWQHEGSSCKRYTVYLLHEWMLVSVLYRCPETSRWWTPTRIPITQIFFFYTSNLQRHLHDQKLQSVCKGEGDDREEEKKSFYAQISERERAEVWKGGV